MEDIMGNLMAVKETVRDGGNRVVDLRYTHCILVV